MHTASPQAFFELLNTTTFKDVEAAAIKERRNGGCEILCTVRKRQDGNKRSFSTLPRFVARLGLCVGRAYPNLHLITLSGWSS